MKKLYFLFVFLVISCSMDEGDETPAQELSFKFSQLIVFTDHTPGEFELNVTSNYAWQIVSHSDWLELNTTRGEGDTNILIKWDANQTTIIRKGELKFTVQGKTYTFVVEQHGGDLQLIDYPGKLESPRMYEEKFLLFNHPVKLNRIYSGSPYFSFFASHDDVTYFDNDKGIRFRVGSNNLGSTLAYKYSVTDIHGTTLEGEVDISLFTAQKNFNGQIKRSILDDDNNLWILSHNSEANSIYRYSFENDEINKELEITLGDRVHMAHNYSGDFIINPYNDLIYYVHTEAGEIEVYTKTGNLVKKIDFEPENNEVENHSNILPQSLGFNKSGMGIVRLSNGLYPGGYMFIDSANDDELSEEQPPYDHAQFITMATGGDKTSLWLTSQSTTMFYLTAGKEIIELDFRDYAPNIEPRKIVANKLNNNILVRGSRNNMIFDPNGNYRSQNIFDVLVASDFSYDPNYSNHVYSANSSKKLNLINFDTGEIVFSYNFPFSYDHSIYLHTTQNNDYIIIPQGNTITLYHTTMFTP